MLAEFGIVPDVFDRKTYSCPELGDVCLSQLLEVCREEAVVRDFCDGAWSDYVSHDGGRQHHAAKEVLETLAKEGRLQSCKQALPTLPETDAEWYYEASKSNEKLPLDVMLAGSPEALGCENDSAVTTITQLGKSEWWRRRSPTVELRRTTTDYLKMLRPILKRAGSFMFIDPHLDEEQANYSEFCHLIRELGRSGSPPRVEIHIAQKATATIGEWKQRVRLSDRDLSKARMSATVHVWPVNFHDRYLITNLIGLQLPYGFDIGTNGVKETTWARLGRREREAVELRFEPNTARYGAVRSFTIGADGI